MRIALAHQHLRHIVQDREQTVEMAPKIWGDKHKELFDSGRISFQAQDFFTAQPTVYKVPGVGEVKHAAVFVLTRVTHSRRFRYRHGPLLRQRSARRVRSGPHRF